MNYTQLASKEPLIKRVIFILSALLVFLFFKIGFIGFYGYDDLIYTDIAKQLTNWNLDFSDHFSFRWGLIIPMAICYKIFGFNDFSGVLPVMLYSIGILYLVYKMTKNSHIFVTIIALAFTLFTHWNLAYSIKIMADIPTAFAFVLAIYSYFSKAFNNKSDLAAALTLAIALILGFATKGTIVLIIPVIITFFIIDIINRKNIRFWIYSALLLILFITTYFLIIKTLTGNFFTRFNSISANSYLNRCSYGEQPTIIVLKRILIEFWDMMIYQKMFIPIVITFASTLILKFRNYYSQKEVFITITALILIASSNFMSISFSSYNPMCIDPRHYLFITPFAGIAAASFLHKYSTTKKGIIPFSIITFSLLLLLIIFYNKPIIVFYFKILFTCCILPITYKYAKKLYPAHLIILIIFISSDFISETKYSKYVNYKSQKEISSTFLRNITTPAYIISDDVQKNLNKYYLNYDIPENIKLINTYEFNQETADSNCNIYIIDNEYTKMLSGLSESTLPFYFKLKTQNYKEIINSKKPKIRISKVADKPSQLTQKLIFSSLNTFDYHNNLWSNSSVLDSSVFNSAPYSEKVIEYSTTINISTDSINKYNIYTIKISGLINSTSKSTAGYVLSIEKEGSSIIWKMFEFEPKLKAYGNFIPIKYEHLLNNEELPEQSTVKVYIWNKNHEELFVDDIKVEILGIN